MKCVQCGGTMAHAGDTYRYDESGLPNVVLKGVEVRRCRECGEEEAAIPNIEGLHRCIADHIVRRSFLLSAAETGFLRRFLGYSGQDFAALMGVTPETVSRWEHGRLPLAPPVDRALRLLVVREQHVESYDIGILKQIRKAPARPAPIEITRTRSSWRPGTSA